MIYGKRPSLLVMDDVIPPEPRLNLTAIASKTLVKEPNKGVASAIGKIDKENSMRKAVEALNVLFPAVNKAKSG